MLEKGLTYAVKLVADVYQMQDININTGEKVTNQVGSMEKEVPIGTIPICVRSKYCNLNLKEY